MYMEVGKRDGPMSRLQNNRLLQKAPGCYYVCNKGKETGWYESYKNKEGGIPLYFILRHNISSHFE
jgi:hypothetical protein